MRMIALAFLAIALALWQPFVRSLTAPEPRVVDTVEGDWVAKAKSYQRARLVLMLLSLALTPLALWLFLRLGWSAALRSWLEAWGLDNPWLFVGAYTVIVLLLAAIASLPLDYAALSLRRAYGLTQEPTGAWLVRQTKAFLVGLVIGLVAVEGLYFLLRNTPRTWWIWASAGMIGLSLLLAYLFPLVITPLFYKQRPLEDQELREQIMVLAERAGVRVEGVYVINASTTGSEGNAYFTGIGGSTRIVLFDTLLDRYPREEIVTILAHELGHWRYQHVWKGLALSAALTPLALLLVHLLLQATLPAYGIRGLADVAGLPLIALILTLGATLLIPGQNWLSRQWERQADRFALEATNDPQSFIATFERLARQNLADPAPAPLVEAIFYSHPSIARRIEMAREYAEPVP